MLDIYYVRENFELIKKNLKKRKDPTIIILLDEVLENDKKWRKAKAKVLM